MAIVITAGCTSHSPLCDTPGCLFTRDEWQRLSALGNLPDPPADPSNEYTDNPAAQALGHKLYFDPFFSGTATHMDQLGRSTELGRAAKGHPLRISCNSCHDVLRAGGDITSMPGHVSVGAGVYDVNGQQTVNAAYYPLLYWNGRSDSLWAQAASVTESPVSMNGNRLKVAWRIADAYRTEYQQVFSKYPFPLPHSRPEQYDKVAGDGQCRLTAGGTCPTTDGCVSETNDGVTSCWPRFPLDGKRGYRPGCQRNDPFEPFRDAYDCMSPDDQDAINRVFVNYAKAIAAYEYTLISRNAAFDTFVNEGPLSQAISPSAKRGAKLFVGKAGCVDCHNTAHFSDGAFHDVGVPQSGPAVPTERDCQENTLCDCQNGINCLPWGAYDGLLKLKQWPAFAAVSGPGAAFLSPEIGALTIGTPGFEPVEWRRDSPYSDNPDDTSRRHFYEENPPERLKGAWRTPSLRDVALTGPYMHTGVYRTLEEVVWHYNQGRSPGAPQLTQKSTRLRPLQLSDAEVRDLVEFMRTLTGEPLPASVVAIPQIPEEEPL
jgi:cytochrome c peroxidase